MSRLSDYRQAMIDLGYDFTKARMLQTAFELDLFERLGPDSRSSRTLAGDLGADQRSLEMFLNGLVAIGLIEANGSAYSNTKFGCEIFLKGKPLYIGDILGLQDRMTQNWLRLKEAVVSGKSLEQPVFLKKGDADGTAAFIHAMHNTAMGHAEVLARKLVLREPKTLLDIGGGSGAFTIFFLKFNPQLKATIFDLPETLKTTRRYIEQYEMTDRVDFQEGNFNEDDIRGSFDVCFMSHIIHGQDEETNKKLFQKVFACLNAGGKLIVQDFFLTPDRRAPQFAALFSMTMLLHTDRGKSYTFDETEALMKETGFSKIQRLSLRLPRSIGLLVGEKK